MYNDTMQLALIRLRHQLGIGCNRIETDKQIARNSTLGTIVKRNDIGVIIVLQKGPIDLYNALVIAKYIGNIATTLTIMSRYTMHPIGYLTAVDIGHFNVLYCKTNRHSYLGCNYKCKGKIYITKSIYPKKKYATIMPEIAPITSAKRAYPTA